MAIGTVVNSGGIETISGIVSGTVVNSGVLLKLITLLETHLAY